MTLIDINVLLDVLMGDPVWLDWSLLQMDIAAAAGPVVINDIVYAEVSAGYATVEEFDAVLSGMAIRVDPIPRSALFLAAKVFKQYRARGGTRTGVIPDFFIGAHSAVAGIPLVTRDVKRMRSYFPTVRVIGPDQA